MAVARDDAVYNSLLFETEVKGGAYFVTLHSYLVYRRALAGAMPSLTLGLADVLREMVFPARHSSL